MTVLIDMNLSPEWVEILARNGINAIHWASIGLPTAPDTEIFDYAQAHRCTILTQDIDFSRILFRTADCGPSTVLVRLRDQLDEPNRLRVARIIDQCADELEKGALLVVDEKKARLRNLPLK